MNKQSAMSIVSTKIGNRSHLIENGTIANQLYLSQIALEDKAFLPWFLIKRQTPTTVASTQNVAFPTDYIRLDEDTRFKIKVDSALYPLCLSDEDTLTAEWPKESEGRPTHFYQDNTDFWLYPTPDKAYDLNYRAYIRDTSVFDLNDTETNLWLTHAANLLIARTAMVLAKNLQNPKLAEALSAEYQEAKNDLIGADTARRVAGRDIIKGG